MKEGLSRYRNLVKLAESGSRPLYRGASWKKQQRSIGKELKKKRWYGDSLAVLFVQPTPGSILKLEIEQIMKTSGMKVRVVERGGRTVKTLLQKSDVQPVLKCWKDDCQVCRSDPKGNCWKEGVCYRISCLECAKIGRKSCMYGETARSGRTRCSEHQKALESKKDSNLWEHIVKFHNGDENVNFQYEIVSVHSGDPLARQLKEACNIQAGGLTEFSMNDKNEWMRPAGLQFTVDRM